MEGGSARRGSAWRGSAGGGVCLEGVYLEGWSAWRSGLPGSAFPWHSQKADSPPPEGRPPPAVNRMTDMCKNITFHILRMHFKMSLLLNCRLKR